MGAGNLEKLTMPKWGLSMTHGTIGAWLISEGQEVDVGTEVVEIETEKIVGAVESPASGTLRRQVVEAGQNVPVGALLGVITDPDVSDEQIDRLIEQSASEVVDQESSSDAPGPQSVDVGGRTLRYRVQGQGDDPLVLIHGFGGDLNNWLFNHASLAADRAVYAVDLPGHGGSSKDVGNGTVGALAESLSGFLDAVGHPAAHVVGHSLGGAIALEMALSCPERVQSMTLIASGGLGPEINKDYLEGFVSAKRRNQLKPVLQNLFASPQLVTRQMVEDLLKFKRIDGVQQALEAIVRSFVSDGQQAVNYRDRLSEVSVPILVLWGARDQIIPVHHAQELPESVNVHIFEDVGHMAPMEVASEVNRLIEVFLADKL